MKKYLIKGALALFSGGLFFSCAEKESEYVPIAQQKVKDFEEIFKEVYGDNIDPYQDWGFNGGKVNLDASDSSIYVDVVDADGDLAFTRTRAFGGNAFSIAFPNRTRAAYPNANQWAEQGYTVPPELTEGQKLRVQYYFQTVKITNPNTPDYGTINFFMQQVYDGGTDPMTKYNTGNNPTTGQPYSKEVYLAANNETYIESGKHMDHLTAGPGHTHINNFNNSTYGTNGEPNHDVLNSVGVTYYTTESSPRADGKEYHSDQIMLMLNTNTKCFGYANSDASYVRDDRWTLVSWQVIEDYCNNSANGYETWRAANHSNIPDKSLNDGWGRSFIGFDFDMIPDDYVFSGTKTWSGNKITSIQYNYFSIWLGDNTLVWNGTAYVEASTLGEVVDEGNGKRFYPYMPGTTKKVKMMSAQSNEYCGTKQTPDWGDDKWEIDYRYKDDQGVEQYGGKRTRVDYMLQALRDGYLPDESSNKKWYLLGNCADHYYSDWIVSFLPANQSFDQYLETEEEEWVVDEEGRVFCEDLGRATREDLDYNDVVFDAKIWKRTYHYVKKLAKYSNPEKTNMLSGYPKVVEGSEINEGPTYYAQVTLQAAGGTIPISIKAGGTEYQVHDQFKTPEPTAIETMVNTRDNNSSAYGSFATREPVQLAGSDVVKRTFKKVDNNVVEAEQTITLNLIPGVSRIADIAIRSSFDSNHDVQELSSKIGEAPQRFMVDIGTPWASERKNISLAYHGGTDAQGNAVPSFDQWVQNRDLKPWAAPDYNYVYTTEYKDGSDFLHVPYAMRVKRNYSLEGEFILYEGEKKFGQNASWTLEKLDGLSVTALKNNQFSAGDMFRIYAKDMPAPANGTTLTSDEQKAWITVVIGSIRPYFIDQEFPNYDFDNDKKKVYSSSGCLEVVLDEYAADLLNAQIDQTNKTISLEVQGRNFTLTKICVVSK